MLGDGLETKMTKGRAPPQEAHDDDQAPEGEPAQAGIIPRATRDVLACVQQQNQLDGVDAAATCSYMQVYHDKLFDLLRDKERRCPLAIRESNAPSGSASGGRSKVVYVEGLSEEPVCTAADVMQLLRRGSFNRAVRSTEYNAQSSRSHAILQLSVRVSSAPQADGTVVVRRAKLNLVDLAGRSGPARWCQWCRASPTTSTGRRAMMLRSRRARFGYANQAASRPICRPPEMSTGCFTSPLIALHSIHAPPRP